MNKRLFPLVNAALALMFASGAVAEPAGMLLFVQPGVKVINLEGIERPAGQGELIQAGERVLTPDTGITQIKLQDGSLLSVRPNSELKLGADPSEAITLSDGAVRVISNDLVDKAKAAAKLTIKTEQSDLDISSADVESAVVKRPVANGDAAGSYSRLLIGSSTLRSGSQLTQLAPRQINYVSGLNITPITLNGVAPNRFTSFSPDAVSSLRTTATLPGKTPSTTLPAAGFRNLNSLPATLPKSGTSSPVLNNSGLLVATRGVEIPRDVLRQSGNLGVPSSLKGEVAAAGQLVAATDSNKITQNIGTQNLTEGLKAAVKQEIATNLAILNTQGITALQPSPTKTTTLTTKNTKLQITSRFTTTKLNLSK